MARQFGRIIGAAIGTVVALAWAAPASAYYNGSSWNQMPYQFDHNVITYSIDGSVSSDYSWYVSYANQGAYDWTDTDADVFLIESSSPSDVVVKGENKSTDPAVGWEKCTSVSWPYDVTHPTAGQVEYGGTCAAAANADTVMFNFYYSNELNSKNPVPDHEAATHEFGHAVGLDHSCSSPGTAVMDGKLYQYQFNGSSWVYTYRCGAYCTWTANPLTGEWSGCPATPQSEDQTGVRSIWGSYGEGCLANSTQVLAAKAEEAQTLQGLAAAGELPADYSFGPIRLPSPC